MSPTKLYLFPLKDDFQISQFKIVCHFKKYIELKNLYFKIYYAMLTLVNINGYSFDPLID